MPLHVCLWHQWAAIDCTSASQGTLWAVCLFVISLLGCPSLCLFCLNLLPERHKELVMQWTASPGRERTILALQPQSAGKLHTAYRLGLMPASRAPSCQGRGSMAVPLASSMWAQRLIPLATPLA